MSNKLKFVVIFKKVDKRKVKKTFRSLGLSKIYIPTVFAALCAIAIYESKMQGSVVIDTEYPGYNKFINNLIEENLSELGLKEVPVIKFGFVGKESNAHDLAAKVARKKKKADLVISLSQIESLILPNKKSGTT